MSLLDDVSIVVTPNGYKAGELYAVVPVPTEGSEEVTNGDFATDSDWTKGTGWTISGGKAVAAAGTSSRLEQSISDLSGKFCKVNLTLSDYGGGGSIYIDFGSTNSSYINTNGEHTVYGTFDQNKVEIFKGGAFSGSIDNVSVKEYTAADMDVTRATAATRVDEDGLVNYAEIIGGEEIEDGNFPLPNTEWTLDSEWSISSNKANYDNTGTGSIVQNITFDLSKEYKIKFSISDFTTSHRFDIYTGVSYIKTSTIDSETSYTIYFQGDGGTYIRFRGLSRESFSLSNVSVKEVARDNVPRIDYTGGGCPHILAEPQRTNLVTYSEDFTEYSISTTNLDTPTIVSITNPTGVNSAGLLNINNGVSASKFIYLAISTSSSIHTQSIFVKYVDRQWLQLLSGGTSHYANFDIQNGVVGNTSACSSTIEDYGNGWYRCTTTLDSAATPTNLAIAVIDDNTATRLTASTGTGSYYLFGSQVEQGSYATSYIPTSGSTVTRNQDQFSRDGIGSLINSTEGVLFVEMAALSDDLTNRILGMSDGTFNNSVLLRYASVSNRITAQVRLGGVYQCTLNYSVTDVLDFHKIAFKYKVNDFALWIDGVERATDTSGDILSGLDELSLSVSSSNEFFGKIRQLQVYNTALTDAQLTSLTS